MRNGVTATRRMEAMLPPIQHSPFDISYRRSGGSLTRGYSYASSGACSSETKSQPLCAPSQNGFFADAPQRQRA